MCHLLRSQKVEIKYTPLNSTNENECSANEPIAKPVNICLLVNESQKNNSETLNLQELND